MCPIIARITPVEKNGTKHRNKVARRRDNDPFAVIYIYIYIAADRLDCKRNFTVGDLAPPDQPFTIISF